MVVIYDLKHGSEEIDNFNSLLNKNSNKIAYVVHKPGCPACNAFIPNWNIFQENMLMKKNIPNVIIARINVDVLNLVDLKDKNTIFGVPHVSLQNKNKIVKYNGNRTPEDLEKWFFKSNMIGGNKRKTIKRKWSLKYKRSINCKKPKGFSQKQYCKRVNKQKRTIKKQRKR
tara:strand:+ start:321 stop:833 length:513 start_codon:yes stop_codon:yes gene_type:complete